MTRPKLAIDPAMLIHIAEQRLAGRSIRSLAAHYAIGDKALATRLRDIVPSAGWVCYLPRKSA